MKNSTFFLTVINISKICQRFLKCFTRQLLIFDVYFLFSSCERLYLRILKLFLFYFIIYVCYHIFLLFLF